MSTPTGEAAGSRTPQEAPLHYLDAVTALKLFRAGGLSPVELLQALIDRAGTANASVNALTETLFDDAMVLAREAEAQYLRGEAGAADRPLLGLPVVTKEKHALAGRSFSQGLLSHAGRTAAADHPVVERIRAAGGIVHARSTSPEFSCATVTHSPMWGVTRNPWNLERSPGGSSGGAGAALAAGLAPLATASDIAGSTRLPAAFTGTVGYKAPYGRIPGLAPLSADWYRGDGPMARTVADTALLANVMSGRHPGDHSSYGGPGTLPLDYPDAGNVAGLRVALCLRLGDYPLEDAVEANTRAVAETLRAAGAVVEEVVLPWTSAEIRDTIFTHFGHILGPAMETATAGSEDTLAPYTRRFMADARAAAERRTLVDGLGAEARIQSQLATVMDGFDVLLCPTSGAGSLAADADYLDGITVAGTHLQHYWEGHLTAPFNITNRCPVLAVPSGLGADGVPTGVQVVGHPFQEESVFRVGAAIEVLRPWAGRYPQL
ncbi:amidase [Arthrobacter caoxuetaonis]|uniref:amidase n=1 Tax=Arthrobacter caoxuetaonis TaxID=2886935 RepID=UPI001D147FE9|nr:amidase [Arthrobacter caoxuetaonis]MCC3282129.1 amidase [Arthrobacter caoxuetaonis]